MFSHSLLLESHSELAKLLFPDIYIRWHLKHKKPTIRHCVDISKVPRAQSTDPGEDELAHLQCNKPKLNSNATTFLGVTHVGSDCVLLYDLIWTMPEGSKDSEGHRDNEVRPCRSMAMNCQDSLTGQASQFPINLCFTYGYSLGVSWLLYCFFRSERLGLGDLVIRRTWMKHREGIFSSRQLIN